MKLEESLMKLILLKKLISRLMNDLDNCKDEMSKVEELKEMNRKLKAQIKIDEEIIYD